MALTRTGLRWPTPTGRGWGRPAPGPRALTLSAVPGNAYAPAGDLAREHVLFDIRAGGGASGRGRGCR